jgi:hypothetical protein
LGERRKGGGENHHGWQPTETSEKAWSTESKGGRDLRIMRRVFHDWNFLGCFVFRFEGHVETVAMIGSQFPVGV